MYVKFCRHLNAHQGQPLDGRIAAAEEEEAVEKEEEEEEKELSCR
jgi:hypothetical protein